MCSFNLKLKNMYTFLAHPRLFPCINTPMHIVYAASYTHKLAGYHLRSKQAHSETKHTTAQTKVGAAMYPQLFLRTHYVYTSNETQT